MDSSHLGLALLDGDLNILENASFDLVLMDLQMPVLSGADTLKVIRGRETGRHQPVIALTAYALRGDRERFLLEGFDKSLQVAPQKNQSLRLFLRSRLVLPVPSPPDRRRSLFPVLSS